MYKVVAPFRSITVSSALVLACLCNAGCGGDEDEGPAPDEVVANYATLVEANYADALDSAKALHQSLHDLTGDPSEDTLAAARKAWFDSRDPYGESEAFRFYDGPIDNPDDGPEGLINAWPIDERYIDYVAGPMDTVIEEGIINLPDDYPEIDQDLLISLNEQGGETNISTGYHAIEFLLWGQDFDDNGPGSRPFSDYSSDGSAPNPERRAQYLLATGDLLVANLTSVHSQWLAGEANYRADFEAAAAKESLAKMMRGMADLAGSELSDERMATAYDTQDPENEHSCFSDNTIADLHNNATAVQNVLLGRYGELDGPGVDELIAAKDSALAQKLRDQIQSAIDDIDDIPAPFDQAIQGSDEGEGRVHIDAAVDTLREFAGALVDAAQLFDIELKSAE